MCRLIPLVVFAALLAGCGLTPVQEKTSCKRSSECPGNLNCQGGVCQSPQQGSCLAEDDVEFCRRLSRECGDLGGTDNCGRARQATCGPCPSGYGCEMTSGTCAWAPDACVPESEADLCQRDYRDCESYSTTDSCGQKRTVFCGSCATGSYCLLNQCRPNDNPIDACVRESDSDFCLRNYRDCGVFAGTDNCGMSRTAGCAECPSGSHCVEQAAQCHPDWESADVGPGDACTVPNPSQFCLGYLCGWVPATDSCGISTGVDCGGCTPGFGCNDHHHRCEPLPNDGGVCAEGLKCGAEGDFCPGYWECTNVCTCTALMCLGGVWVREKMAPPPSCFADAGDTGPAPFDACVPESDLQFCQNRAASCGTESGYDGCGNWRSVECGYCDYGLVCQWGQCRSSYYGDTAPSFPDASCGNSYRDAGQQ